MVTKKTQLSPKDSPLDSLKKNLAAHIRASMAAKGLDQTQAAELVKTTRARVNHICHGNVQKFTADSLLDILVLLGNEINIEVVPIPPAKKIRLVSHNGRS